MSVWHAIAARLGFKSPHGARLREAMALAKEKRFEDALSVYDSLVAAPNATADIKCQALFNRALVHSALYHHKEARNDLERIVADPAAPANVLSAARLRLQRVKTKSERSGKSSQDDSSV